MKQLPSLPPDRAFIVQLYVDAQPERGHFRGRVEHVVSYRAARFESRDELVAFMVRILAEQEKA